MGACSLRSDCDRSGKHGETAKPAANGLTQMERALLPEELLIVAATTRLVEPLNQVRGD